ncbi:unnamed protein product [Symbiodinium sp. CCMP2592]|nr:unnamed protein product [Symbiodinium sp. CCMP2592]
MPRVVPCPRDHVTCLIGIHGFLINTAKIMCRVTPRMGLVKQVLNLKFRMVAPQDSATGWLSTCVWDQREADLIRALSKWCLVFEAWDVTRTNVADQLLKCESTDACHELLSDYLAKKAPSTCLKRANSMLRLNKYVASEGFQMPTSEPDLYQLLRRGKTGGASLSELQSIMEAVTFVRFVFDVECLQSCARRKRCWGLSTAKKAALVSRADPMRVADILELHRILLDEEGSLWDRLMAGSALYCIYARCRWSDAQHIDMLVLEAGETLFNDFGSAVIDIHKTMHFASRAPRSMELVAVGRGLDGSDWLATFVAVRKLLGCSYEDGFPTMPAPNKQGLPTVRALSSAEDGLTKRTFVLVPEESQAPAFGAVQGLQAESAPSVTSGGHSPLLSVQSKFLTFPATGEGLPASPLRFEEVAEAESAGHSVCASIDEVDPDDGTSAAGDTSSEVLVGSSFLSAMSLVDSEASFRARCLEVCGSSELYDLLVDAGIKTHSILAFSCGTPTAQPTDVEFASFANTVVKGHASIGQVSALKRLHFESSTLVVAARRTMVEGDTGDASKRLPVAEKTARLAEAKRRLPGLVIEDELEPSHALLDVISHMGEANSVVWVPPSKCTKRDAELKLGLRDNQKFLTVQEHGVTLAPAPDKLVADHATPLEVQWCLQRRGIAFFMCGFMSYETHDRWVSTLLRALSSEVPPGYAPISIQQMLRADSEMFLLFAKEVNRVKPTSTGVMEMDEKMKLFRHDPRITSYLQPLQKATASVVPPPQPPHESATGALARTSKRQKRRDERLKAPVRVDNLPEELKTCPHHADAAGHRYCWSFNLAKGCNAECKGNPPACNRGVHGCMTCRRLGHGTSSCWFAQGGTKGKGRGKKGKAKTEATPKE